MLNSIRSEEGVSSNGALEKELHSAECKCVFVHELVKSLLLSCVSRVPSPSHPRRVVTYGRCRMDDHA
ncbi:hypothetical protein R3I93_019286 [Phoxinus phoxinus]|uniref:Uncharacterized protein n=1 Tax=Phoxinus phoxinus TaxID=58324 RepID=A0AAN9GU47_9TELE